MLPLYLQIYQMPSSNNLFPSLISISDNNSLLTYVKQLPEQKTMVTKICVSDSNRFILKSWIMFQIILFWIILQNFSTLLFTTKSSNSKANFFRFCPGVYKCQGVEKGFVEHFRLYKESPALFST